MKSQKRILFYIDRNLHLPFLEPVHDCFQKHYPDVSLAFSAPEYQPSINDMAGHGIDADTAVRLSKKSCFVRNISDFEPQITVVADIGATYRLNDCGYIVNTGHGLTSKGCFYTARPIIRRENMADLICVPGSLHKKILAENVFVPTEITGFITADEIFNAPDGARSEFCKKYGIDESKNIVLFAPTFNDELSAIPMVKERIFELADSENHLVIKLHGMTDEKWIRMYTMHAENNPNATLVQDQALAPCLKVADLLISDVSSAYVEFLLLDRPIIMMDNPRKEEFIYYDPQDIEYRLRDACLVVNSFEQLQSSFSDALCNPDALSEKRKDYAEQICHGRDGKAALRTARAIYNLFDNKFSTPFSVLVFWDHLPTRMELLRFWDNFRYSTKGFQTEVIMAGPKPEADKLADMCQHWIVCELPDSEALDTAVSKTSHDYLAIVEPDIQLVPGWLKYLYCHFKWNNDAGIVQTLTPDNGYELVINQFFSEFTISSFTNVSFLCSRCLIGSSINANRIDSSCFMFKKGYYNPANHSNDKFSLKTTIDNLGKNITIQGYSILKCLDLFVYPRENH